MRVRAIEQSESGFLVCSGTIHGSKQEELLVKIQASTAVTITVSSKCL